MPLERRTKLSVVDVLDRVLDKGIVIDAHVRISFLGIDLLTTIEAHIVVASIDTYLRHADAIRSAGSLAGRMPPFMTSRA